MRAAKAPPRGVRFVVDFADGRVAVDFTVVDFGDVDLADVLLSVPGFAAAPLAAFGADVPGFAGFVLRCAAGRASSGVGRAGPVRRGLRGPRFGVPLDAAIFFLSADAQRSAFAMRCTLTGWFVPSSCAHSET